MSIRLSAARIGLAIILSGAAAVASAQENVPPAQPNASAVQAPAIGSPAAPAPSPSEQTPRSAPLASPGTDGVSSAPALPPVTTPPLEAPSTSMPDAAPGPENALGTPAVEAPPVQAPLAAEPMPGTSAPAQGAQDEALPAAPIDEAQGGPAASGGAGLPHDLSPWGMFMAADWVVQAVMIGLVFASLVTWTIWLAKAVELGFAKSRARAQVQRLEEAASLRAAIDGSGRRPLRSGPVAALALSAAAESDLSGQLPADGVKERVAVALQRIEARSGRRMSRGTGMLATIGSTAPFVGLFGTVWGIMNSFIGIAETNTTNLAIVAPGIAEALLATGIGLVAAIPAVIIYNVFARSIAGYRAILADGSAAVLRHLSRDLDRRDAGNRYEAHAYAQPAE